MALIGKWKVASREAAEEVFGDVRDRVNRMGGVGAWREREGGRGRGGGWGFDDGYSEKEKDGEEGEGMSEGERERRRAEVEDLGGGDGERGGVVEDEGADDDVCFVLFLLL